MLGSSFDWISPSFQNVRYPPLMHLVAWSLAMITLLILVTFAVHTIIQFIKIKRFSGSFEPTERWVPDLVNSLNDDQLESMAAVREKVKPYHNKDHLIFGIGKPKLSIKVDNATQTDEQDETNDTNRDVISNQREKHFYLEVHNGSGTDYEMERKHNENEVIAWNQSINTEKYHDYGILEKYVQTVL